MYIPKLHKIWLCQNDKGGIYMYPKMANRHGLIAGATGTGKTVTLKVLAESFSEMGVPVFLADIKGDVSGMCLPGEDSEGFRKRLRNKLGLKDNGNLPVIRCASGTFTAREAFPCAQPFRKWDRICSAVCWS